MSLDLEVCPEYNLVVRGRIRLELVKVGSLEVLRLESEVDLVFWCFRRRFFKHK